MEETEDIVRRNLLKKGREIPAVVATTNWIWLTEEDNNSTTAKECIAEWSLCYHFPPLPRVLFFFFFWCQFVGFLWNTAISYPHQEGTCAFFAGSVDLVR